MWLNKNDQMVVGMGGLDVGWVKKKKKSLRYAAWRISLF